MPKSSDIGPNYHIIKVGNFDMGSWQGGATFELNNKEDGAVTQPINITGSNDILFEIGNDLELIGNGVNPGISEFDVLLDRKVVKTVATNTNIPSPQVTAIYSLDTTPLCNGIHEITIQAFNSSGTPGIPDYFQGHITQNAIYDPIFIKTNNAGQLTCSNNPVNEINAGTFPTTILPNPVGIPPSPTQSPTNTSTPIISPTIQPTATAAPSVTPTAPLTITPTSTIGPTSTVVPVSTVTPSPTTQPTLGTSTNPTNTPNPTTAPTITPTYTVMPTIAPTLTPTVGPTATPTGTITPTIQPTVGGTPTPSPTGTITPMIQPTVTFTSTPSPNGTIFPTPNNTFVPTPTTSPTSNGVTSTCNPDKLVILEGCAGQVVNTSLPVIKGVNANASYVRVQSTPQIINVTPDGNGNWSFQVQNSLENGNHTITVYDAQGNILNTTIFVVAVSLPATGILSTIIWPIIIGLILILMSFIIFKRNVSKNSSKM